MKFRVEHLTQFEYETSVFETTNEIRLQPCGVIQQCEDFTIKIDPSVEIYTYNDYFGNAVHYFSVLAPHDRLSIVTSAIIQTCSGIYPATEQELSNLYDYQFSSRYAILSPAAIEYASRFSSDEALSDPEGLAQKICETILSEFEYKKGVTDVDSTVDQLLEQKRGVCQDFAHLMITLCRCLGLPARYVSGYIYIGDEQEGASHAWCEIYCGAAKGWIGFDPTRKTLRVNDNYIKIGTGRDYADVTPVRGTYKGKAKESLKVRVRISKVS